MISSSERQQQESTPRTGQWGNKTDDDAVGPPLLEQAALYRSDDFRMYCYKMMMCPNAAAGCQDWSACPFAHPGEKARRRDLRTCSYSAVVCQDFVQRGKCQRGERCGMVHSVFEHWLHPQRYRTVMCKEAQQCNRDICFFAHSEQQLRVVQKKKGCCNIDSAAAAAVAAAALQTALRQQPVSHLMQQHMQAVPAGVYDPAGGIGSSGSSGMCMAGSSGSSECSNVFLLPINMPDSSSSSSSSSSKNRSDLIPSPAVLQQHASFVALGHAHAVQHQYAPHAVQHQYAPQMQLLQCPQPQMHHVPAATVTTVSAGLASATSAAAAAAPANSHTICNMMQQLVLGSSMGVVAGPGQSVQHPPVQLAAAALRLQQNSEPILLHPAVPYGVESQAVAASSSMLDLTTILPPQLAGYNQSQLQQIVHEQPAVHFQQWQQQQQQQIALPSSCMPLTVLAVEGPSSYTVGLAEPQQPSSQHPQQQQQLVWLPLQGDPSLVQIPAQHSTPQVILTAPLQQEQSCQQQQILHVPMPVEGYPPPAGTHHYPHVQHVVPGSSALMAPSLTCVLFPPG